MYMLLFIGIRYFQKRKLMIGMLEERNLPMEELIVQKGLGA